MTDLNLLIPEVQKPTRELALLDTKFFTNRPSKWTAIAEHPQRPEGVQAKLTSDGFAYKLEYPAFIQEIEITGESCGKPPAVKVEIIPISDDPPAQIRAEVHPTKPNVMVAKVNMMVRGFRVSADAWITLTKTLKVTQVAVHGYSLGDLEGLEADIQIYRDGKASFAEVAAEQALQIAEARQALVSEKTTFASEQQRGRERLAADETAQGSRLQTEAKAVADKMARDLDAHQRQLEQSQKEKEAKDLELKELTEKINRLLEQARAEEARNAQFTQSQIALKTVIEQGQQRERDLAQKIADRESEIQLKTTQVAKLNDQLHQLNNDVSLFADDLKGFAKQGGRQIKIYLAVIVVPCIFLAGAFAALSLQVAWQLAEVLVAHPDFAVGKLLSLKIPFAILASSVLGAIYKIAMPFVNSIREINEKRLKLSEISILARDVSDSAAHGQELTQEDRDRLRLVVRMALVRDYLTGQFERKSVQLMPSAPAALSPAPRPEVVDPASHGLRLGSDRPLLGVPTGTA